MTLAGPPAIHHGTLPSHDKNLPSSNGSDRPSQRSHGDTGICELLASHNKSPEVVLCHTHFTCNLEAEANDIISRQFRIGKRRIKPRDRRLFKNKSKVLILSLTGKLWWPDRVEGPRRVWIVDQYNESDYHQGQQGMSSFTGRPEPVTLNY